MAEAFALAAGVAGFVSLTVQLGQGLLKLRELHKRLQDAPATLDHAILTVMAIDIQIQSLRARSTSSCMTSESNMLEMAVELCHGKVRRINNVIDSIEAGWKRSERFGRLKVTMKEREMRELLQQLEQLQMVLLTAVQLFDGANRQAEHLATIKALEDITLSLEYERSQRPHNAVVLASCDSNRPVQSRRSVQDEAEARSSGALLARLNRPAKTSPTLRIRPWLLNVAYSVTAVRAACGWDIVLRTHAVVEWGADILQACEAGNLAKVQQLFAEGRANPTDQSPYGESLLDFIFHHLLVHQSADSFNLVRYLGSMQNLYDMNLIISGALAVMVRYIKEKDPDPSSTFESHVFLTQYEALLDSSGFDVNWAMANFRATAFCVWAFAGPSCMRLVARRSRVPWNASTLKRRFGATIYTSFNCKWEPSAWAFLNAIGGTIGPEIAAIDCEGTSLLHLVALHSVFPSSQHASEWRALARELIISGAFINKVMFGLTPLAILLCMWCHDARACDFETFSHKTDQLRAWVAAFAAAGVDLAVYGAEESRLLPQAQHWLDSTHKTDKSSDVVVVGLQYGSLPGVWDLVVQEEKTVHVYESVNQTLPGCWNSDTDLLMPRRICWAPRVKESAETHWTKKATVRLRSPSMSLTMLADKAAVRKAETQSLVDNDCYQRLHRGVDDHSMVITTALRRSQNVQYRRRSSSVPTLPRRKQAQDFYRIRRTIPHHSWLIDYHNRGAYKDRDKWYEESQGRLCTANPLAPAWNHGEAQHMSLHDRLCGQWQNDILRLAPEFLEGRGENEFEQLPDAMLDAIKAVGPLVWIQELFYLSLTSDEDLRVALREASTVPPLVVFV
ncbi:hypothetical protein LTS10_007930 [Elasticomyces elasticus]|nr:hypothetical protein LTS10_007930 [Elasticomyces elasticus]